MPLDIYQAYGGYQPDDDYFRPPLSCDYVMVGPGIAVPLNESRQNGLGKSRRKKAMSEEDDEEKQSQVYLAAPASMTQGFSKKTGKGRSMGGKGFYLAGQGGRGQSGGAAHVHRVASKLLHRAYPAVFRGLGAALHHRTMYQRMQGRGMRGSGKVGAWFRKAGQSIKGALKSAGHWAKEKIWQPLLERAKKLFGDFIREKLKQYIPDSEAGIQAKADELLDKAFSWIVTKIPPGWNVAATAAFEVLRSPLRELAASAIKKGFDTLHKVSASTGINMNFDKPEPAEADAEPTSAPAASGEDMEVPEGESSGKGYGGHMFGGRKISSAQLSALVRAHAMKKFDREPKHLEALASY